MHLQCHSFCIPKLYHFCIINNKVCFLAFGVKSSVDVLKLFLYSLTFTLNRWVAMLQQICLADTSVFCLFGVVGYNCFLSLFAGNVATFKLKILHIYMFLWLCSVKLKLRLVAWWYLSFSASPLHLPYIPIFFFKAMLFFLSPWFQIILRWTLLMDEINISLILSVSVGLYIMYRQLFCFYSVLNC